MKLACQEGLVPGKDLAERFERLEAYGYEGIEIWGNTLLNNPQKIEELKRLCSIYKIKVSTVCSGYRGCFLDPSLEERQLAIRDLKELLSIASDIGAVGVIMVPIFGGPRLPNLSPLATEIELERKLIAEILKEVGEHAQKVGSVVLVEPLNRYETHFLNRLEQAVEVCQEVNNPAVKIMADFFHMHIEEADIAASIRAAGSWIYHIHLADSNRLQPGAGHTDFKEPFAALKEIGYQYYMALECGIKGEPEEALKGSAQYLKGLM